MKQEIGVLNYEPLEKNVARLFSDGTIHYEVQPEGCETKAEATLYWNKERRRWLAEVSGKFLEGYERGEQVFLDFSHQPRELNTSACKKILEAYHVPEENIKLEGITNTSPKLLRKISGYI